MTVTDAYTELLEMNLTAVADLADVAIAAARDLRRHATLTEEGDAQAETLLTELTMSVERVRQDVLSARLNVQAGLASRA